MKAMYTWLIYSCLFFGSAILCDRKNEKRQAVSSCSVDAEDKFYCSNGLCIEWSWVCDGRKDCSDGSDETKEMCARYEYGTNMNTSCGKVYVNDYELIGNDEKSTVVTLPWKVGLYEFIDSLSIFAMFCGGSIIAPNVVISAAQCFWERNVSPEELSAKNRLSTVVVGKYDRNVSVDNNVVDNDNVQLMNVENVFMNEGYNGFTGLFAEDIAVIILTKHILFSSGVAPVCVDWNNIYNVKNGDQGKIVIRGSKNGTEDPVLFEKLFQYTNSTTCRKLHSDGFLRFLTFDKFCTDNTLEQKMVAENTGSGISFLHDNSYYLTGILSITNKAKKDSVLGFTDIKYYVQWIRVLLNKHLMVNSCILPTVEGVVYSYEGSNKTIPHGKLINHNLTIIEDCEVGYHKAYRNGLRVCLGKGKWLFNFEKLCFKMCPPLESDSLDIKCSHNGKYANCSNLSIPGTIATPSCKPSYYYTAPHGQDENPPELLCQSDGAWNKQLYRCNPYCGRVYIVNQVLIENGEKAPVGTAPWNVGIYRLNKKNFNYDLICGGSIISTNLVVSAAHCFWQKGMLSKKISINDGLYKVSVGKYARDFSVIDNDFTQTINVEMIHLNEGYYGPPGFHAEDIAIIVLQNRVSFSNGVAPVCIDWSGKYNVVNGDQGKIVGWGKIEKDISSPILLEASLPYIDHSSCRSMYTNGFEPYVTVDKFCAGSASGQAVGTGDSGAGLCFNHSGSYYLTGVVSIKDPNTHNSIAVFTDVKHHIQWIRRLYNKYN